MRNHTHGGNNINNQKKTTPNRGDSDSRSNHHNSNNRNETSSNNETIKCLTLLKAESLKKGSVLDVSNRGIESIVAFDPDQLIDIRKLNVSRNQLKRLRNIPRKTTFLQASENQLDGPALAGITEASELNVLNLSKNIIRSIPNSIFMGLSKLGALILNNNEISSVDFVKFLPTLNTLVLSHNKIASIDSKILSKLVQLTKISLSNNLLETVPDLSCCKELTEVRIARNKISAIPRTLGANRMLKTIDIGHNKLENWNEVEKFACLYHLKNLNLVGNPLCPEIISTNGNVEACLGTPGVDNDDKHKNDDDDDDDESDSEDKKKAKGDFPGNSKKKENKRKSKGKEYKEYKKKMDELFPKLAILDGHRIKNKQIHGYLNKRGDDEEEEEGLNSDNKQRSETKTKKDNGKLTGTYSSRGNKKDKGENVNNEKTKELQKGDISNCNSTTKEQGDKKARTESHSGKQRSKEHKEILASSFDGADAIRKSNYNNKNNAWASESQGKPNESKKRVREHKELPIEGKVQPEAKKSKSANKNDKSNHQPHPSRSEESRNKSNNNGNEGSVTSKQDIEPKKDTIKADNRKKPSDTDDNTEKGKKTDTKKKETTEKVPVVDDILSSYTGVVSVSVNKNSKTSASVSNNSNKKSKNGTKAAFDVASFVDSYDNRLSTSVGSAWD